MIGTIERTNGGRSDFSAATEAKACHICQYTTLPSKIKGMPPSARHRRERVPVTWNDLLRVMAGLVPAIHVFLAGIQPSKAWMAGT
jgi:hypothetical protein